MLPAAFFSYHGFCKKERKDAADRPIKFILVLGKIFEYMYIPYLSSQGVHPEIENTHPTNFPGWAGASVGEKMVQKHATR